MRSRRDVEAGKAVVTHDGGRATARENRLGEARPAAQRSPRQTEFVRAQMAAELRGPLPCDDAGLPVNAPAFPARTDAVG